MLNKISKKLKKIKNDIFAITISIFPVAIVIIASIIILLSLGLWNVIAISKYNEYYTNVNTIVVETYNISGYVNSNQINNNQQLSIVKVNYTYNNITFTWNFISLCEIGDNTCGNTYSNITNIYHNKYDNTASTYILIPVLGYILISFSAITLIIPIALIFIWTPIILIFYFMLL